MGRILPCLVPILACNLHQGESIHSSPPVHLINREPSLSPGRGEEKANGVSAPPQLHSRPPCSADCSVLHLCACAASSCAAAAHAAPPSRLTHRQFGQSSSGRVCNQWWCNSRKATQVELLQQLLVVMVQLQQTDTADCRLQRGSCCYAASISSASSYGCLGLPRDIPVSTRICCQNSIFSTTQVH